MSEASAPINFEGLSNTGRRAINYDAVVSPDSAKQQAGYENAHVQLNKPTPIRVPYVVGPLI